jgi:hypothetical protein
MFQMLVLPEKKIENIAMCMFAGYASVVLDNVQSLLILLLF